MPYQCICKYISGEIVTSQAVLDHVVHVSCTLSLDGIGFQQQDRSCFQRVNTKFISIPLEENVIDVLIIIRMSRREEKISTFHYKHSS